MKPVHLLTFSATVALASFIAFSADDKPPGKDGQRKGGKGGDVPIEDLASLFRTDVPSHALDVVLARPTKTSITASVLAYSDREGVIQFGPKSGAPVAKTAVFALKAGVPAEIAITGLQADAQYFYKLSTRAGTGAWTTEPEHSFRTQRAPGRTFTFTVQADPHLDDKVEPKLLERSLLNCLSDAPDFLIDLGDTFMTDKYRHRYELAAKQYVAQRHYFGLVGHSAPVFLVLGNHDGEMGGRRHDEDEAVWSNTMRKKYFANPIPDTFYTGDEFKHPKLGLLQDYYAWTWGDALFVVLDPFWFSKESHNDNWQRSLGEAQYQWLKRTLEGSRAKFKFIFLHHLVGGATPEARGGSEAAPFYEWGGKNADGTDGFAAQRPGWPAPIHQLLVQNRVSIVFHGHDHIFAKQDLDGIVYQEVPQPGNPDKGGRDDIPRTAAEYGYVSGKILGSPGYMHITVAPEKVTAEFVRSYLPVSKSDGRKNHEVAYSYTISANGKSVPARDPGK
jgi:predicted phosphodiesterase